MSGKIAVHISEIIDFERKRTTFKLVPYTKISDVKEKYCKLRGRKANNYMLFYDGAPLSDYKTFEESQMSQKGSMYVLEILSYSEAQKKIAAQASADIMTDEEMKAMAARRMTRRKHIATQRPLTITSGANPLTAPPSEYKLKITEKVNNQLIACDLTVRPTMIFEKIAKMYCKHRKYNESDYVFMYGGRVLDGKKPISELGLIVEPGKPCLLEVFHKTQI